MKKIIAISNILTNEPYKCYEVLGPKYLVQFDDQTTAQIYADHFIADGFEFDLDTPNELIGKEMSKEFIEMFCSPKK